MLPSLSPRLLKTYSRTHARRTHSILAAASTSAPRAFPRSNTSSNRNLDRLATSSHLASPIAPFHTHSKRTTPAVSRVSAAATPTPSQLRISTPSLASYIRYASTQASEQSISYV